VAHFFAGPLVGPCESCRSLIYGETSFRSSYRCPFRVLGFFFDSSLGLTGELFAEQPPRTSPGCISRSLALHRCSPTVYVLVLLIPPGLSFG